MQSKQRLRVRKRNWTESEHHLLLDHMDEYYPKLFGKFSDALTAEEKKRIWKKISTNFPDRTINELRRKFTHMKSVSITSYGHLKKQIRGTGGGPPPKPTNSIMERILVIIGGDDNPKIAGVCGGVDTKESGNSDKNSEKENTAEPGTSADNLDMLGPFDNESDMSTEDNDDSNVSSDDETLLPIKSPKQLNTIKLTTPRRQVLGEKLENEAIMQAKEIHALRKKKLNLKIDLLEEKIKSEKDKRELFRLLKGKLETQDSNACDERGILSKSYELIG